jgi:hypothetical protein
MVLFNPMYEVCFTIVMSDKSYVFNRVHVCAGSYYQKDDYVLAIIEKKE